jgi:hypothetical protein
MNTDLPTSTRPVECNFHPGQKKPGIIRKTRGDNGTGKFKDCAHPNTTLAHFDDTP